MSPYTEIPKVDATTGALPPKVLGHLDGRYGSTLYPVGISAASRGMSPTATANANSAALNAAIAEAAAFGAKAFVPLGSYFMNAQIVLPENAHLDLGSAVLDFSGSNSSSYFGVTGTAGPDKAIPATVRGTYTISVAAHGLVAGDWVKMLSSDVFDPGSTNTVKGELLQVDTATADTVTFATPVLDNYVTSPLMFKVTMRSNVRIENGTIKGAFLESDNKIGIRAQYVDNFRWINGRSQGISQTHISIRDGNNAWVEKCNMYWARHSSMGYGASFANATRDSGMIGCNTQFIRHAFSTNNDAVRGGITRRIMCHQNTVNNSARAANAGQTGGDAIDTHTASEDIWITYNVVNGSTGQGINFEGASGEVIGNKVYDTVGTGVSVHNKSAKAGRVKVCWNESHRAGGNGFSIRGDTLAALGYEHIDASHNQAFDSAGIGISIGFTKYDARVVAMGNGVVRAGTVGMSFAKIQHLAESGNVTDGKVAGIRYNDVTNASLGPDTVTSSDGAVGFVGIDCINVAGAILLIGGVSSTDPTAIGVKIGSSCSKMTVGKYAHINAATQFVNDGPSSVVVG